MKRMSIREQACDEIAQRGSHAESVMRRIAASARRRAARYEQLAETVEAIKRGKAVDEDGRVITTAEGR